MTADRKLTEDTSVPIKTAVAVGLFMCGIVATGVASWYQVNQRLASIERREKMRDVVLQRISTKLGIEQTWPLEER